MPETINTKTAQVAWTGKVTDQSRIVDVILDGQPIALNADGTFEANFAVAVGQSVSASTG